MTILLFAVAPAHAQGVAGTWNATFDSDITTLRDSVVVKARASATLTLTQRGDSVFGTWKTEQVDRVELHGTFDGRTLRLTTGRRQRSVRINGEARLMLVRTDFDGVVDGARITGTMVLYVGDREPPPRKWEARRK